jgi:hypothetical protein
VERQEWVLVRRDRAVLPAATPVAVVAEEWLGRASESPVVLNFERRQMGNSQITPADYATASIFRTWIVLCGASRIPVTTTLCPSYFFAVA